MKILGITGGIGAGKSRVSQILKGLGATVIDADSIARQVLEKDGIAYPKVVEVFGKEVLKSDQSIDRKDLAALVFANQEKLALLNGLVHPCVFEEMKKQIQRADTELICLDVPLLFSCDFPIFCDKTLAVIAPQELRIQRVMERDGVTREETLARMANQLSDEEFRQKADMVLVNDGDEGILSQRVKEIYCSIMEIAE